MAGAAGVTATRDYVESYLVEDAPLLAARGRAQELGCSPVSPAGGALLRFLARLGGARAVVELGTGTGVSGLWLLRGMRPDGVLTSVDTEAEHQRAARQTFAEAGIGSSRTRLIHGAALEVLPRLTDGAYDLVFCDAVKTEYADYLTEALRLLRPGGVLVIDDALDGAADTARDDAAAVAVREMVQQVREDEQLIPVLLPTAQGLLAAVKRV